MSPKHKTEAEAISRVYICDRAHPHFGESGVLTGKMISLFSNPMAEVKLDHCKHGVDGCYVSQGQIAQEYRGNR